MEVFITGASGFVGRALVARLAGRPDIRARLLMRDPGALGTLPGNCTAVAGRLERPGDWTDALAGVDRVVHLAAVTGKAAPEEYDRVNCQASAALVAAAKAGGAGPVILVSTIAAGYPDRRHYPYAETKLAAERDLSASGHPHTILRPTIVLGPASPIAATLAKIAGAPVIPMPGLRRGIRVQPVHVDDVARALVALIDHPAHRGEVLDLGGPEALPFAELMARLHTELTGRRARLLPVPLAPIRAGLALVEPVARAALPVTAGQLAVFANPSTARPNWLAEALAAGMTGLDEMLAEAAHPPAPPPGGAHREPGPARAEEPEAVTRSEFVALARHLAGVAPDPSALRAYRAGVLAHGLVPPAGSFDAAVLALARSGRVGMWLADGHAALLARSGRFRRRMILAVAILEKTPPAARVLNARADRGPVRAFATLAVQGAAGAVAVLLGAAALGLFRLLRVAQRA